MEQHHTDAPPPPRKNPFDTLSVRSLAGTVLVSGIGALVLLMSLMSRDRKGSLITMMILLYVAVLAAVVVRGRFAGVNWKRLLGPPPRVRDLPLLVIIVPLALLAAGAIPIVFVPVSYFAPDLVRHLILNDSDFLRVTSASQFALVAFLLMVAAPVVEELIFRGLILHRLARRFTVPVAVMVSSFLFAMLHVEWVGHCILGIGFALLYLRTRSLWISMLAHGAYNGLFTIPVGWAWFTHQPDEGVQTLSEFRGSLGFGVAAFAAGMFLLYLYFDLYWPNGRVADVTTLPLPHDDSPATTTAS